MLSGLVIAVSRDENLLQTRECTVDMSIVPLAYIEGVVLTERFINPARNLAAA
jgi:hypothetical protein